MTRWPVLAALLFAVASCAGAATDAPPSRHARGPRAARDDRDDGDDRDKRDDPARAQQRAREEALAAAEPDAIAPSDRAAYFDAVTGGGTGYRASSDGASGQPSPEPDTPDPERVRKVLRLDALVGSSDPALAKRIHDWLVGLAGELMQAYANQTARVLASPPASPWHRAETAWVAWVNAHVTTLSESDAYGIGLSVFAGYPEGVPRFPGFDRFAFGLAVADMWIREGHPGLRDHRYQASEDVVCSVENSYGKLSSYCEDHGGWWYRQSLATDEGTQRLAQAVLARKDPMLTRAVALGIGLSPRTLDVLHTWEQDAGVWRDALLVLSREDAWSWMRDWLFPELRRVWTAHAAWHGPILYALAQASGQYPDDGPEEIVEAYGHFARDFAGGVTRADFAAFLDQAPRALELARWMMPSRTRGWSVADVVLPRLDAYFALPHDAPEGSPRGPGFASVFGYLCYRDHDLADLAKLKAYFDRRAPAHPGDPLNLTMDPYGPKECRDHG